MNQIIKKQLVNNIKWSFIGQISYILIALIANIYLAHKLTPNDFGIIGILVFFLNISRVLIESGLGGSIVRSNDINEKDYSTVFIFNLIISILLSITLFLVSDIVSEYYNNKDLSKYIKLSSIILVVNSFQFTQTTKLVKGLHFKKKSIYDIISIIIGTSIGLLLAYNDYGVYSFIYMQLVTSLSLVILLSFYEGLNTKLHFSYTILKKHLKFGVNTTISSILNTGFDNIYNLILAKYFSLNQTGFLYQSKKINEIPTGILNKLSQSVVFSSLSKIQDDKSKFEKLYNEIINVFTLCVGLICLLIYTYSKTIVLIIYGEKWIGSVFYIDIFIIASFFYLQEMFNRVVFKIYNKTHIILRLEIIKKIILSISIIISLYYLDLKLMMYGFLISSIISYIINYVIFRKTFKNLKITNLKNVFYVIIISIFTSILFKYYLLQKSSIGFNLLSIPLLIGLYIILNIKAKNMNIKDLKKLIINLKKIK